MLLPIVQAAGNFYPRSPRGERPAPFSRDPVPVPHFYPRSPRGERRAPFKNKIKTKQISIHAPREGSDGSSVPPRPMAWDFYPRSPRGERHPATTVFLSDRDFYPRSPRGERPSIEVSSAW